MIINILTGIKTYVQTKGYIIEIKASEIIVKSILLLEKINIFLFK